ncbi:hypothetical protein LTR37_011853 [Vermiconidia calcicola]|uniref:Uncharacterized protein n=1 Tax=Vermiconidia calcicola TaxID=1690605 RepID=A0ACC3N2H5_9PEZI|nr:hypothetical protein LTR37_011853 [Vermiconidia calcicola]
MGSIEETKYSVPAEAQKLFDREILDNPLIPSLPQEIKEAGKLVNFTGNDSPSIPINWRFAESVSAMKAFEASMLNVLRAKKYGTNFSEVSIDTDHASLFFMTPFLTQVIDSNGQLQDLDAFKAKRMEDYGFKNGDLHRATASLHRVLATNIYKTKDGRFYHCHGSMNPEPTLTALKMPLEGEGGETFDSVVEKIQAVVSNYDSETLDKLMNEEYKQAGTIAWTVDEFLNSEHGKVNDHVGLYDLAKDEKHTQPASWWPEQPSMPSSPQRPLAGLKVVDLTRVIAAPTITRGLAEMGASVMRVTSPNVTDHSGLHQDLNWGKWNCSLDLKKNAEDRNALAELIKEADVVVEGYRPGAMARNGFSREDIFELVKDRNRGIVHVRENCYGWNGPWMHRSGWQQISDACCGVSLGYGRAMGHNEAVTPVFPNSDYCTGVAGCIAVLHALIRRSEEGGCFGIDAALNYYSQWLIKSVGTYPEDVWQDVWQRHGSHVYHNTDSMQKTLPDMIGRLKKHDKDVLFKPNHFEQRESKAVGHTFVQIKPIAKFKDGVQLRYNVGTRPNGVDAAKWPGDLGVEIVT